MDDRSACLFLVGYMGLRRDCVHKAASLRCLRQTLTIYALERIIRRLKGPDTMYACVKCKRGFHSTDAIRKHAKKKHGTWVRSLKPREFAIAYAR